MSKRTLVLSCAVTACAISPWAMSAPVSVTLQLDQWQSPYPFRNVTQTQTNAYFTTADEYCGFFSGLVTVGTAAPQRYVFFCTEMNQSIGIGTTYESFTMYSTDEYLDTPFKTGRPVGEGGLLNGEQKAYDRSVFLSLGFQGVAGFVSAEAQDLTGFLLTTEAQTILNTITPDKAAMAQISIWEMTHEPFDAASPRASLNLHTGLVQWAWQGGTPFDSTTDKEFEATVQDGFANSPEPAMMGMLGLSATAILMRRKSGGSQRGRSHNGDGSHNATGT